MSHAIQKPSFYLAAISITASLIAGNALANKPDWAGHGKHKESKEQNAEKEHGNFQHGDAKHKEETVFSFSRDDRSIISDYYGSQMQQGNCPPGLKKKNNGCQAPGQAKKWQKGQALAKDVNFYELPGALRTRLPAPPSGSRYVQVANDILLISVGSRMVIDAIEDILH